MVNDNKYGRLYPERAVAPLFALVEGLLLKIVASIYGHSIQVEESELRAALNDHEAACFPPDEPLFLLRGQDEVAPEAVDYYATEISLDDAPNKLEGAAIRSIADDMRKWTPRKLPD